MCTDSNSRLGHENDSYIGPFGAEKTNIPGKHFGAFIKRHKMWLPGTFEHIAKCAVQDTKTYYYQRNGMLYRNDYAVLPESTMYHNIEYRVLHDVDVQTVPFQDHIPVFCKCTAVAGQVEAWYSYGNPN